MGHDNWPVLAGGSDTSVAREESSSEEGKTHWQGLPLVLLGDFTHPIYHSSTTISTPVLSFPFFLVALGETPCQGTPRYGVLRTLYIPARGRGQLRPSSSAAPPCPAHSHAAPHSQPFKSTSPNLSSPRHNPTRSPSPTPIEPSVYSLKPTSAPPTSTSLGGPQPFLDPYLGSEALYALGFPVASTAQLQHPSKGFSPTSSS